MLKIGLTGGIGSGKSTVARVFQMLGVPVFDADAAAKKIMNENSILKEIIKQEFGDEAYIDDMLNRKYLANIVFKDKNKLEKLNAIVHPFTVEAGNDWANKQTTKFIIKEAALMFEAESAAKLDYVIGVFAPIDLRISRVINRDGTTKEEVEARIKNQMDENEKMKLCDFVILNDEKSLLLPQIIELNKKILAISQ